MGDGDVVEAVVTTALLELAGLAVYGVVTLVGAVRVGAQPPSRRVHRDHRRGRVREGRPPRRLAVVAALPAPAAAASSLLGAAATNWALPPAADPGIGLLVGCLFAMPAGVAVPARFIGGEEPG